MVEICNRNGPKEQQRLTTVLDHGGAVLSPPWGSKKHPSQSKRLATFLDELVAWRSGDYFLAATAKVFDLTLITADEQRMKIAGIRGLADR